MRLFYNALLSEHSPQLILQRLKSIERIPQVLIRLRRQPMVVSGRHTDQAIKLRQIPRQGVIDAVRWERVHLPAGRRG